MFKRMFETIFGGEIEISNPNEEWADAELERLAADLYLKRERAIEYLGDKWILKGGDYTRANTTLGQK